MTRVLVTGGSGFIAAHILAQLLERGHSVVTTVRSEAKADGIRKQFPNETKSGRLGFAFVSDFSKEGAFDEAVVSDPPFEAVIHTASPVPHGRSTDVNEVLEPAIRGTVGILHSTKKQAPQVKSVVITSSFATIIDSGKDLHYEYSEKDWNPIEVSDIKGDVEKAYRVSKTLAEKAAWEFLENEKPNFTISTIAPPWVFGPLLIPAPSLSAVNVSNELYISRAVTGDYLKPAPRPSLWVDVRDLALAHVLAVEKSGNGDGSAANKRFFFTAGTFNNRDIIDAIAETWPDHMKDKLPNIDLDSVDADLESRGFDNSLSRDALGFSEYRSLRESVIDTVKSLPELNL